MNTAYLTVRDSVVDMLRDYQQWVHDGAPRSNPCKFNRYSGLCGNLLNYPPIFEVRRTAAAELKLLFRMDGLDEEYPFNAPSDEYPFTTASEYYEEEGTYGKMHLNQKRMDWIQKVIDYHDAG